MLATHVSTSIQLIAAIERSASRRPIALQVCESDDSIRDHDGRKGQQAMTMPNIIVRTRPRRRHAARCVTLQDGHHERRVRTPGAVLQSRDDTPGSMFERAADSTCPRTRRPRPSSPRGTPCAPASATRSDGRFPWRKSGRGARTVAGGSASSRRSRRSGGREIESSARHNRRPCHRIGWRSHGFPEVA